MLYRLLPSLVAGLISCALANAAQAPFIYRGQLTVSGQPASGTFDLTFGLASLPDPGLGILAVVTNQAVPVTNGAFAVTLDFGTDVFDGSPKWLETGVRTHGANSAFTLLSPRQPLLSVPSALQANVANRAAVATNLVDGGLSLREVPAASLFGSVPLSSLAGITHLQMDPATDSAYRDANTNQVRAIVQTTSGPGRLTPMEFGAKGDGITDDTTALQAWIDACQTRNLVAELPPASAFYRITDSIVVRKPGGLTLVGAGGQSHITGGPPYTRSRLHQVTPGKHGLVITNFTGSATPTDNIYLQGFMVTAETYSPTSYGIAFNGGIPDSDVNVIMNVATKNFGVGLFDGSGCNMSVISCSFGYCGDGIQINGPVVNSVFIQSTILTGNRSNGLHVVSAGNITFDTGDIVTWKTDRAHLATIEAGLVCIRNMNGEQGSPVEGIKIWSPKGNANVLLDAGGVMPVAAASERTYSLSVSNARSVTISGTQLNAIDLDGFPIVEYRSPPVTTSLRTFPQKVVVGNTTFTNWLGNHFRTFIPKLDGSSLGQPPAYAGKLHSGLFSVFSDPADTELVFSANLSKYNNQPAPVNVPLLQYAKDRLSTMTVSNLTVTGTLKNGAGASGSVVNYPGVLTRVSYENGIITGTSYEAWAPEALDYSRRARLTDPLEVAAADSLVKNLKAAALWPRANAIYLLRGESPESAAQNLLAAAPIEWKNPNPACFTPSGVVGDGSLYGLAQLPSTTAQLAPNSLSLMVYNNPARSASAEKTGPTRLAQAAVQLASFAGDSILESESLSPGAVVLSRASASEAFLFANGQSQPWSTPAAALSDRNLTLFRGLDQTGVPGPSAAGRLQAVWVGASLTPTLAAELSRCFDHYFAMLGLRAN